MNYKVLAINPGSTSIKIALFEDEQELFSTNIKLIKTNSSYAYDKSQYFELRKAIVEEVSSRGYNMEDIDAYSSRGAKNVSSPAGVYEIDDKILEFCDLNQMIPHPKTFGPLLAKDFEDKFGGKAYILNASVDEFDDIVRVTGYLNVWRESSIHVLSQKEVGKRVAEKINKNYDDVNFIIAHLGGGITITAHKKGRMVDSSHGGNGDGPIAPTRSGFVPNMEVIKLCYSGKYTQQEMLQRTYVKGGLMEHLRTDDAREIEKRIVDGDEYAKLVYDSMIYQIAKYIGSLAIIMEGNVDGIVLTGGMANSNYAVEKIKKYVDWIAKVFVMTGEYEMEYLGLSVLRVLKGEEDALIYTGIPMFDPKVYLKKIREY